MKKPDIIYVHRGLHLGMLTTTAIKVGAPDEEEYIRKDLVEHIIRGALGPQDALNKIRSL